MRKWLLLAGAIALVLTPSLSLKEALDFPELYVVVVIGYLGSFFVLSRARRYGMPLGVSYGIWGSSGIALTALLTVPSDICLRWSGRLDRTASDLVAAQ